MKIIGLSGKIGAGKDTVHQIMHDECIKHGLSCVKISFADPLKDLCSTLFGWDRDRLNFDTAYKESNTLDSGEPDPACQIYSNKTRRMLIQEIGTECFRDSLDSEFWIKLQKLKLDNGEYDEYDIGFITDCRFLNEIQFVKNNGGSIFKINRTGGVSTLTKQTNHSSEIEWESYRSWDDEINNYIDYKKSKEANLCVLHANIIKTLSMNDIIG
jgi:hypothetical protein